MLILMLLFSDRLDTSVSVVNGGNRDADVLRA